VLDLRHGFQRLAVLFRHQLEPVQFGGRGQRAQRQGNQQGQAETTHEAALDT